MKPISTAKRADRIELIYQWYERQPVAITFAPRSYPGSLITASAAPSNRINRNDKQILVSE